MNTNSTKSPTAKECLAQACQSIDEMVDYLEAKARNHHHYKRYTTYDYLKNWIDAKSLFLSTGDKWNDTDDEQRLSISNEKYTNFCICFTFSKSENVAMWMLYGGLHQHGAMIDYSAKELRELINGIETIDIGYWEKGKFHSQGTLNKAEFEITFTDVLYCEKEDNGSYTVKRSDARYEHVSCSLIRQLNWRQKSYPWCYENECRLVITVKRQLPAQITTVRVKADKLYETTRKQKRIYHAPNSVQKEFQPSQLNAHINWCLCKNKCMKSYFIKRKSWHRSSYNRMSRRYA